MRYWIPLREPLALNDRIRILTLRSMHALPVHSLLSTAYCELSPACICITSQRTLEVL